MTTLNIGSEGMGSWSHGIVLPIISRAFKNIDITFDKNKPYQLVLRSQFYSIESYFNYTCPYITWTGEPSSVTDKNYEPISRIKTVLPTDSLDTYIPHLVNEIPFTKRLADITVEKTYCLVYANSNSVQQRENVFNTFRNMEPTCYSYGKSCFTNNNPTGIHTAANRGTNWQLFSNFGLSICMENQIVPGYVTEKIGQGFMSSSVPIYWGDSIINDFFNPESFLNVCNFSSHEKLAETAINIWKDKQKLQAILDKPIRINNNLADLEAVRHEYKSWQKPMILGLHDAFPDLQPSDLF
jgi:hypothetical protein